MPEHTPIALVTGASSGIGAATAVELARRGHDVLVHFNSDEAGAQETAAHVRAAGRTALTWRLDLSSLASSDEFWSPALAVVGDRPGFLAFDVLVANAGIDQRGDLANFTASDIRRLFEVNAIAPLLILQGVPRGVLAGGAVVLTSSTAAQSPIVDSIPYSATKAAVETMTHAAAVWLEPHRIRVNAVAPGAVATPLQDPSRVRALRERGIVAEPEQIAEVIAFLAGRHSEWIDGQVVRAAGPRLRLGS